MKRSENPGLVAMTLPDCGALRLHPAAPLRARSLRSPFACERGEEKCTPLRFHTPSARKGKRRAQPSAFTPPSARRGSRRSRGGMALRDKEPSPRSRCARSLRSALRRGRGRDVRSPRLSHPSARKGKETCAALGFHTPFRRKGSRRRRGRMALRDKEPSPRSRCARSLRSALRRGRGRDVRSPRLSHPLPQEGGRDEVAGGWRCGTKNHPLGRAARVRFAPPFGAKGEETCAALGFHPLRRERGKRRAQPSAFTPFGTKGVATKSRGDDVA